LWFVKFLLQHIVYQIVGFFNAYSLGKLALLNINSPALSGTRSLFKSTAYNPTENS